MLNRTDVAKIFNFAPLATKFTWCSRAGSCGSNAYKIRQIDQFIVEIRLAEVEMYILMDFTRPPTM
jgi:hypothetical protein